MYELQGNPTFTVNAAIGAYRAVKLSSGKLVTCVAADTTCIGFTTRETFNAGDKVAVRPRTDPGEQKAIAAAAIALGAVVYLAANGKLSTTATSAVKVGIATSAAGADGDSFTFLPNTD